MGEVQELGKFKFLVPLAKAGAEGGSLFVEGIASSTALDSHGTVITEEGQASMAAWANKGQVILGGEADHFHVAFDDDLGYLSRGEVTEDGDFYVRAELDADNPRAAHLHRKLQSGTQLGLSVFGEITKSHTAEDGTPMIDGVRLYRVMVTPSPANPDTWINAVAKALPVQGEEGEEAEEPAPFQVAKGKFLDLLRAREEREEEWAPVAEQFERVDEIAKMTGLLFQAADEVVWEGSEPEDIANAIAGAISEYQEEVVARSESEEAEGVVAAAEEAEESAEEESEEAPDVPAEETEDTEEEAEELEEGAGVEEASESGASEEDGLTEGELEEGAVEAESEPVERAQAAPDVDRMPMDEGDLPEMRRNGMRVARSFAEAAELLLSDGNLEPDVARDQMGDLLKSTARELSEALPARETPEEGVMPGWAKSLARDIQELRTAIENVAAAKAEASDRPSAPQPKSVQQGQPSIRPSRKLSRAKSMEDVVIQMFYSGDMPEQP